MEQSLSFEGRTYNGVHFDLGNVPLIVIKAKAGYVACGYVDKATAEKHGDVACFVSNVKSFDDVFRAKVRGMTSWAEELGIREGMSVKKALEIIDSPLV
ncbi:DUF1805 domain-containing protein [Candidatus Parvarchaeota archaeon]|nr:DUF1805 domain-containing protein [Candidatus Parvarchaeota archaeon]